jgi:hypothetical protein
VQLCACEARRMTLRTVVKKKTVRQGHEYVRARNSVVVVGW